ncbi:MAG: VWA domain-containing protein [Polaribacter sp.]|nr:VWA domain-containing protein [Polaribacter sp.]
MKSIILKTTALFLLCTQIGFANPTDSKKIKKQTIKMAILLDTSNSMDGLIDQAKAQLWQIVNELSYAKYGITKPDLEIAIYEYGNASLAAEEGFIRMVLPFNSDLDEISEKLFSLKTNGGSEYCGHVIDMAVKELTWGKNEDDLKLLFIAGNEPFTQGTINYKEAIANAKEKGILINTIFCGDYSNGISGMWKDGAALGGGDYMTIDHNKKIVHIVTPYDEEIIILNKKLNGTYIYFGDKGSENKSKQYKQDVNAAELNEMVIVNRAISKSSRLYENSTWDLVDAMEKKNVDLEKIDKKSLPKELQNKSASELKNFIALKTKERKEIQTKIKELDTKRKKFIATKQLETNQKDILENVMIQAIKKQALLKNYSW